MWSFVVPLVANVLGEIVANNSPARVADG